MTTISGVAVVAGLISLIGLLSFIRPIWLFFILLHLYFVRKFLVFVYRERGVVFAIKSFFMGLILYCFIFAGAFTGRLTYTK